MANITIPNLPQSTSLDGTELLLGVQSGTSKAITTGQIVSLATGGGGTTPITVPIGGTGNTTFDNYGVLYGDGTNPIESITPPTGSNYILVASPGTIPAWQENIPVTAGVNSISFGSTGLTPNTATEGVVTVAGTLVAASGGTGQSSYTIGDLLYASSSTALSKLADVATGSVLISGGVGAAPSYSASPTLTTSLTTPFLIGGTTASSSLTLQSTSGVGTTDSILFKVGSNGATTAMTINTSGQVGIGTSSPTDRLSVSGSIRATFAGTVSVIAQSGDATDHSALRLRQTAAESRIENFIAGTGVYTPLTFYVGGAERMRISTAGLVSFTTALAVGSGGTGAATFTANGVIYGNTTSAFGVTAAGTTGQVLVATTSGAPSWGAIPSTAAVTSITFGTTGLTPSTATTGAVTVAGTLAVANGGTGATTANAALTNLTTFTTTATAGGTTVLTNTSTYFQFFTGTLTQTITLPVTSTLGQGWTFNIVNNGTGDLTVNSSGGNFLITVLAGTTAMATCILTSGTTAASWEAGLTDFSTATGAGSVVLATSPTLVTPALGVATATSVAIGGATIGANALAVTGSVLFNTALAATSGGTGQSSYAVGDLLYASTTTALSGLADVATGQVLVSRGVGVAPSYSASPTATNWYNTATQTATNTATLTAAQITGPFLLGTPTATASYTLPLASAVETALGTPPNETGWEFVVFTTAAFAITLLTNTGWTLVGSMATGATANSFARFRCRKTGAAAYSIYRIS